MEQEKKLYPNQMPKPYMIGRNVVAKESVKLYEWLKKMERLGRGISY